MSRFYGSLRGSAKTLATRRGNTASGITGHIRGWDIGVEVASFDGESDGFHVYVTGGTNGRLDATRLATVELLPNTGSYARHIRVILFNADGKEIASYVLYLAHVAVPDTSKLANLDADV